MNFDEYYNSVLEFSLIEKAIRRSNASKKPKFIEQRTKNIISAYNEVVKHLEPLFRDNADSEKNIATKELFRSRLVSLRDRLIANLGILQRSDITVPRDLRQTVVYTK